MRDACRATAAFLVWPDGEQSQPLPRLPYATPERIASYSSPAERRSAVERMVEKAPGGRSEEDQDEFAIYRLLLIPHTAGGPAPLPHDDRFLPIHIAMRWICS